MSFQNTNNPETKHYHREARRQQEELIKKIALFKELNQNNKNLARRNHLIQKRHSNGLIGGDSPEKTDKVAKVYAQASEKLRKTSDSFNANIHRRCAGKF